MKKSDAEGMEKVLKENCCSGDGGELMRRVAVVAADGVLPPRFRPIDGGRAEDVLGPTAPCMLGTK